MTVGPLLFLSSEANDVTKQSDLGRFYQHLLDEKTRVTKNRGQQEQSIQLTLEVDERKSEPAAQEQSADGPLTEASVEDKVPRISVSLLSNQSDDNSHTGQAVQDLEAVDATETQDLPDKGQEARKEHNTLEPCLDEESVEERRKKLFAKRTTDDARLSAKERYLARKKQRMSHPVIASDD